MILYGPFGWGTVLEPLSVVMYYPPSGEDIMSWLTESPMLDGSNLIFTDASVPSKFSVPGTLMVGDYTVKSEITTGTLALGSTCCCVFCPSFSILHV